MRLGRLLAVVTVATVSGAQASNSPEVQGRALFEHEWTVDDPLSGGGDGLGPLYNATSCVACHSKGGVGGSGDNRFDVDQLVTAQGASVLHKSSVNVDYAVWRDERAQSFANRRRGGGGLVQRRNTPALFGIGLIDGIPDSVIKANVQAQDSAVRGQLNTVDGERVGRFGWKGDIGSLRGFVEQACAMELGLTNAAVQSPADPTDPEAKSYAPEPDMTEEQIGFLTGFLKKLPRPKDRARHPGRAHFERAGCDDCHTPDLGDVQGLYSDLAMHDLGDALAGGGGSYGRQAPVLAGANAWRTPPLWGVADSAPYLHDGRAQTLYEAIRLHGGQAQKSAASFLVMRPKEQAELQHFLLSLKAPDVE